MVLKIDVQKDIDEKNNSATKELMNSTLIKKRFWYLV